MQSQVMPPRKITSIKIVNNRSLVRGAPLAEARDQIRLPGGIVFKPVFRRGRLVGGNATNRRGKPVRVFLMRISSLKNARSPLEKEADAGTQTCYICAEIPEQG